MMILKSPAFPVIFSDSEFFTGRGPGNGGRRPRSVSMSARSGAQLAKCLADDYNRTGKLAADSLQMAWDE